MGNATKAAVKGTSKVTKISFLVLTLLVSSPLFACDSNPPCSPCAEANYAGKKPSSNALPPELQRFYDIDNFMDGAYKAGKLANAKAMADEYLALAAKYPCDWNYGNAIHDANAMLGLISLKAGNADAAADYLLKAGKTRGSPQLDSFGPELDLANALLKNGNVDAVKAYLNEIKSFWTMDNGNVDRWLAAIDKGERPELSRSAVYVPLGSLVSFHWIIFLWPTLITIVFAYIRRKHIGKMPLFLFVGLVCVYVLVFLGNLAARSETQMYITSADFSKFILRTVGIAAATVWLLPVVVLIVVARFFRSKPLVEK